MKQIRHSIFETNSSSTHALILTSNKKEEDLNIAHIELINEPFLDSYEYREVSTAQDKINYFFTYYLNKAATTFTCKQYLQEVKEILEKKIGYKLPIICKDLAEYFKSWAEHSDGNGNVVDNGGDAIEIAEESLAKHKVYIKQLKDSNFDIKFLRDIFCGFDSQSREENDKMFLEWAKNDIEIVDKYGCQGKVWNFNAPYEPEKMVEIIIRTDIKLYFGRD